MSWHETVQSVDRFWPMDWLLCRTARPHPGKPSSSRQRAPTSSPLLGRNHVGLSVSLQLTKCHETLRSLTGTMTRCCHNVTATKPWKTSVLHTKNVIPTHWAGADLNRRHTDFQSVALPTELPTQNNLLNNNRGATVLSRNIAGKKDLMSNTVNTTLLCQRFIAFKEINYETICDCLFFNPFR